MKHSYGGVIINQQGQVLLREASGHHNGYIWTFAKGEKEAGESDEETALREVFEETGVRAQIIGKLPGSFDTTGRTNEYFLMVPLEETGKFHWETTAIRWVSQPEAKRLISLTTNPDGRARDLRVLEAAFASLGRKATRDKAG